MLSFHNFPRSLIKYPSYYSYYFRETNVYGTSSPDDNEAIELKPGKPTRVWIPAITKPKPKLKVGIVFPRSTFQQRKYIRVGIFYPN